MYQAAGHEWQQVEKHGMTSPATLTAVWGRYLIQGLHDVLSIWFFTFFFPGLYSDKYLLLFPGLGSLYFRPFVSNVKIQIPSRLVWRWRFRLVYFVWGDRFEPRLGHRLSWLFFFLWFSSVLSGKFIGSTSIWPRWAWSKSIYVFHSIVILL